MKRVSWSAELTGLSHPYEQRGRGVVEIWWSATVARSQRAIFVRRCSIFGDKFPTVEFHGVEAQHDDLVSGIREGRIDIAITASEARYPGLSRASFWSERLLIAMPAGHELASRDVLHWVDLQQETLPAERQRSWP
jgi:DNA-binding transcriptional LysR family regulator